MDVAVHDRFRSEDSGTTRARNSVERMKSMNNLAFHTGLSRVWGYRTAMHMLRYGN